MRPILRLLPLLLALALSTLAHAPALGNGYVMDDRPAAHPRFADGRSNVRIAQLQALSSYFGTHYWHGHKDSSPLYRPLTTLSFALVESVLGDGGGNGSARAQHALNLALHLAATLLVWLLLRGAGVPVLWSMLGATLFGTHALRTEVVNSIVGRAELLSFCFGLAASLILVHARRLRMLPIAAVLLFLSFASKESGLAWIALAPLLAIYASRRRSVEWRSLALRVGCTAIPAALLFLWLRTQALAGLPEPEVLYLANPLAHADPQVRIATSLEVIGHALLQSFWPMQLSSDYGPSVFELNGGLGHPLRLLGALALFAFLAVALGRLRASLRGLAVAAVWLVAFVPVSNLLFPIGTIYGERLLYTPLLALSLGLALVARVRPRWQVLALTIGAAFTLLCGHGTYQRAGEWRDNATLFRHDAPSQPRSARLRLGVASLDYEAGRRLQAERGFEEALRLYPGYPDALLNLATLARERRQLERCVAMLTAVFDSRYASDRQHRYPSGRALAALGFETARLDLARQGLEAAAQAAPDKLANELRSSWPALESRLGHDWVQRLRRKLPE